MPSFMGDLYSLALKANQVLLPLEKSPLPIPCLMKQTLRRVILLVGLVDDRKQSIRSDQTH